MIIWTVGQRRSLPEPNRKMPFSSPKPVKPLHFGFMAKPCQLAFGVVAHVEFGLFDSALEVSAALQILDHPAIAVSSERV